MSEQLACYAVTENLSRGRISKEKPHPYRSDFERDRDRIIHCSAFRRLEGKTQVFTPGPATPAFAQTGLRPDDYYRTRLTHSIEVAQIGRTIAKELRLNINLTEAICLAHDLGHPPFGHAGEKVLDDLMSDFGGFEHNLQSLRIVDLLENPYPQFSGLNLMYETRLGLAKHRTAYDKAKDNIFTDSNCSLEGQVTDMADRIAYNCHDLEDGTRAGLISSELLQNVQIFTEAQSRINAKAIKDDTIRNTRTAKAIIDRLVSDCIDISKKTIAQANIQTVNDVYRTSENFIVFSTKEQATLTELEKFLLQNLYSHKSIIQTTDKIKDWLSQLFEKLCQKPQMMPGYFQRFTAKEGLQRTVCDYIAGMTDRFCLKMLEKI
ncbi:MAG: deoxyguanosinetriphosphate triphosphohydrolase [Planctomycetota bacterium]|nr:MAG: deoxyguanosinetriphosphate triphosphohydrolase [Planctomycetota bacterium]